MARAAAVRHEFSDMNPWRATLAGLCATLVGIGLARFAYTPLIPALIEGGWFTPSQAAYLGAANLAGYLAGALLARPLAARVSASLVLRAMMMLATATFFACAVPLSFSWFFVWRFASGLSGGVLMVLAAPTVLSCVPPSRRGLAGGVIFTGVGLGIAASGTLVPPMLRWGLFETWIALGALASLLTVVAWGGWPEVRDRPAPIRRGRPPSSPALMALYVQYTLIAAGLVPHMVFLVDFLARGLDQGLDAGARHWVLFGFGAMAGPVLAGHLGDRIGFGLALRLTLVVQAIAVGWLAVTDNPSVLIASSMVVGAFVPGVVSLVLGRVHELLPNDPGRQQAAWSVTTMAFALGQAAAAYGFSFLFERGGGYGLLFALGAGLLMLALAIDLAVTGLGPGPDKLAADKSEKL